MNRNICVLGAREHNLKNIDLEIPRNSLTVITGLSGSGKSSLAFDTIYSEGQRRYLESLSAYARQFLDQMPKPDVDFISGLSPAISIEQKTVARHPRSTVGTVTEIYDYMRVLFTNVGTPHCPQCQKPLERQSLDQIVETILSLPKGTRLHIYSPVIRGRKGEYNALFQQSIKEGIIRAKIDGEMVELDNTLKLQRNYRHDISLLIDRFIVSPDKEERLQDSIELALRKAKGLVGVEILPDRTGALPKNAPWKGERTFSQTLTCAEHGPQIVELAPRMFSFNSPFGACETCQGLGVVPEVSIDSLIQDENLSIAEGAVVPWQKFFPEGRKLKELERNWGHQILRTVASKNKIKLTTPWKKLTKKAKDVLLYGTGDKPYEVPFRLKDGEVEKFTTKWEGLVPKLRKKIHSSDSDDHPYDEYLSEVACPDCNGARLKPESLAVTLNGENISSICTLSISDAAKFFDGLKFNKRESEIAFQPLKEIRDRLGFLLNVGLHYLTLDRHAGSLSGGEAQRIRLATQIGSKLVGVLYVLDEPSIGLHQRDNEQLINTLCRLRDLGNTVLVVEHDEQTIRTADHVIDIGPTAGEHGGEIIAQGTPKQIERSRNSPTGHYLKGTEEIEIPSERRKVDPERILKIIGARHHNLKNIDVELPLGTVIGVTGVSGSGKSSLILETLVPALMKEIYKSRRTIGDHTSIEGKELVDKLIHVDQTPIGRTPRSNPATYTKVFGDIRELFAQTSEARMRGYAKGRFSFNVKGGRCEECKGDGLKKIEMHFLPDVYVHCDVCDGRRYNLETLDVKYHDKSINEVLNMSISDALEFFSTVPQIARKLQTLEDVGLGYIRLGQPATTLSGGEAQRMKLARELAKRNTGKTLYILDEPTTGLHFHDVRKLLEVFQMLVAEGSTVVVIEHNLDIIKSCDYLIDLGPEGGEAGGKLIACGTPEKVAKSKKSITGKFLKEVL